MSTTLLLHDAIVRIVVELRPPQLCLSIRGELDLCSSELLGEVGRLDLTDVTEVLIDLDELSFCDLAGLRAIALLHDTQRLEQRTVRLVHPQRCVARLAQIVGRTDLLPRPTLRVVPGEARDLRRAAWRNPTTQRGADVGRRGAVGDR